MTTENLQQITDPVSVLKALVAIPSVNPMGRDLSGDDYLEGRLTHCCNSFLVCMACPAKSSKLSRAAAMS